MNTKLAPQKKFLDIIQSHRVELLYLIKGQDNDRPVWYYLEVDKKKVNLLKETIKKHGAHANGKINLSNYGKLIKCGWGEEPPYAIKKWVEEQYG
ncbi:MAG: hypothetical protein AAF195_01870 [Pseudomonadota bacterium]